MQSQSSAKAEEESEDWRFQLVELIPWENDIIWDDENIPQAKEGEMRKVADSDALKENRSLFPLPNAELESGEWVKNIIWSPDEVSNQLIIICNKQFIRSLLYQDSRGCLAPGVDH